MDEVIQIELTSYERDVLLRGLCCVRSSIMLETQDPKKQDDLRRGGLLDEIQMLFQRLEATDPVSAAGV
jgi:hypothetical protein